MLLVRALVLWGINTLALIVVDWMFSGVTIVGWGSLLIGSAVLTFGNVIVKPILAILTLPLIVVTFGLAYFAINVLMLALAEWIAPEFSIDGFWTYVGATIVVWLVNLTIGWFLDRVATHMLAFEGDSHVEWFQGNYEDYETDLKRRKGIDAEQPHRAHQRGIQIEVACDAAADSPDLLVGAVARKGTFGAQHRQRRGGAGAASTEWAVAGALANVFSTVGAIHGSSCPAGLKWGRPPSPCPSLRPTSYARPPKLTVTGWRSSCEACHQRRHGNQKPMNSSI